MPPRSLLALLLCATAGLPARAEKPALVVQAQPAAALIAEGKALAKLAGGTAPADFDDWLEDTFGEDGLKGLDLTKPLLAYSTLKGPAADCKFFAILPVSKEADFLDLLERLDREATPVAGDATLHRIGDEDDEGVLHFRFHKGAAHFVLRGGARDLDPKTLLEPKDLIAEGEPGLLAATLRPAGIDATFRKSAVERLDKLAEELAEFPFLPPELAKNLGEWSEAVVPLAKDALRDADSMSVRLIHEPGGKSLSLEAVVTARKGTPLAKGIAARKPAANRFGGLLDWPATAAVLLVQQPSWNAKACETFVLTLKNFVELSGLAIWSEEAAAPVAAILAGLAAPGKAGTLEFGAVLTAPDKSGFGGAALAVSHSDPAALLKALQEFAKNPPEELGDARDDFAKALTLDAAKIGDLAIHTLALKGLLPEEGQKRFGEKALLAFAFGKDALYLAAGPDAVGLMKRLVAVKPGASDAFDLRANPKKLAACGWFPEEPLARHLGKSDALGSITRLSIAGTGDPELRFALELALTRFGKGPGE